MSELALKLIAENKAKQARGEDASFLDLGRCGLRTLPDLSDMDWLETLVISNKWWDGKQHQWIESVNIGSVNKLKDIYAGSLPSSLRALYLGGVSYTSWGKDLTQLHSLDLSGNQISDWDFLEDLTQLHSLDLSRNQISNGDFLTSLPRLQSLNLSGNQISNGDFLKDLTQLQSLDLSGNQISNGDFLKDLTQLHSLDLSGNQISNGDFLKDLTQLHSLDLSGNQFSNGDFLKDLTQLHSLDLSGNQFSNGDFLKDLTNLKFLNLSHNQISDLSSIAQLKNLKEIDFSSNPISTITPLENLLSLQNISCSYTSVTDLSPLIGLSNLRWLEASHTQIKEFPKTIFERLSKIEMTQKRMIQAVKEVKNQAVKNQQYEKAGDIRDFEVKISRSWEPSSELQKTFEKYWLQILLGGNPLEYPPLEIVEQGTEAILRYFEDLEIEGEDQIYEAKLLLIGEGGAGKTTLCRKLFDPEAPLPQEKDRTKGIDIYPLYFEIPGKEGKPFRLNIWDFAGQGKYQSAHSFFYTHRSLYVLVDDARTLNENDAWRALYNNWLQTAELFGGQSPVLVLHNEKEGCARMSFSLGGFQERFPFVHGELFRINLGGGEVEKIADLRRQIERKALALPHIGDTVPRTWVKVREAIEAERRAHPYISAERYRALCVEAGITVPERQANLSRYFHDLGVFLHFQDNPLLRRDVFLQNQWVTDAVYKILDDAQIAGEQRGRFTKADLARLWHESTYHERRDELLALMLQFELCYQVQDTETYICPQLLPGDVPPYDIGPGIPLQLKYEYVFMPKGLLYRLIVRLHRHIAQGQTAVWNSGVVLERQGSLSEITESLDRRIISLRATGLHAKELVTIIHDTLEGLHAPFGERLKVTVKVPCNCRMCKESNKPHFYDKQDLDRRIEKEKQTVECSVSYDDVPVRGLLEGVFAKNKYFTSDEIKKLLKSGKTERALEALCTLNHSEAPALMARFSAAQREYLGGRTDYQEFEKVVTQVSAAGIDLLQQL